jgi:hypothetical protein
MRRAEAPSTLDLIRERLRAGLARLPSAPPTVQAYACWLVLPDERERGGVEALRERAFRGGELIRQYQWIAVAGYLLASGLGDRETREAFGAGVRWMQGRRFFVPNSALQFEMDGLAILGVALGIEHLPAPERKVSAQEWIRQIARTSLERATPGLRVRTLLEVVRRLDTGPVDGAEIPEPVVGDVIVALRSRGVVRATDAQVAIARSEIFDPDLPELSIEVSVMRIPTHSDH